MKHRIQLLTTIIMTVLMMNTRAIAADSEKQVVVPFSIGDPILLLQKSYPSVYNNLFHDFKNVALLNYSVEGNALLISFTSNNIRIFAVYSADGEFRYSIAYIGLVLPLEIAGQLKREYPGYSVYYGKEIRTNNKKIHEVVIENKYEYRVINFLDAEMEEVKRQKK